MEKLIVPRLEHLAFVASFEEILSNLAFCPDHCPEGQQPQTVKFSSLLLSKGQVLKTSQCVINYARKRLDHYLVGVMNDTLKKKYVEMFYNSFSMLDDVIVDPCVFLDTVLDDTFQELETHVSLPGSAPNLKLISSITEQSSLLQKLKLDFSMIKEGLGVEKVAPLVSSLSSLQLLTSLNLYQMDPSHRSVLKLVGNCCPLLTHLSISGFRPTQKDLLAIIFGECVDDLFPDYNIRLDKEMRLECLKAPPEILTPICFSLRHLQLGDVDWGKKTDEYWSVTSFALHHLPLLEKMDGHSTSFGIVYLNGTWGMKLKQRPEASVVVNDLIEMLGIPLSPGSRMEMENSIEKRFTDDDTNIKEEMKKFDKSCCKVLASRSSSSSSVESHFKDCTTFAGSLSLISLDFVCLSPVHLIIIPKCCPRLREVVFWEKMLFSPEGKNIFQVAIPLDDVEELLENWPKLETITFMKMSPDYVRVILNAFAPSLKSVTFNSCQDINAMDLIPCYQLETLRILKSSSLAEINIDPGRLSPSSFLPHLKSFESAICLDRWTLWLEGKSELTHVVLDCCHIGTSGSIHSNWTGLPKIWPKVETLNIRRCAGLTMSTVANIVPQLTKLKELSLPENVMTNDPLAAKIWEDLSYQPAPIRLLFSKSRSAGRCPLLVDYGMMEWDESDRSEEDSSDDSDDWESVEDSSSDDSDD